MPLFRKRRTSKVMEGKPNSPLPAAVPVNSPEESKKRTVPRPPQWRPRETRMYPEPLIPTPPPTRAAPPPPSEDSSPGTSIYANGRTAPDEQRVSFLLGRQDPASRFITPRLFCLHPSVLRHSPVLSRYERYSVADEEASKICAIQLPDLDPRSFNMYIKWLNTKRAPHHIVMQKISHQREKKLTWREAWPLVNAHILATTIEDPDFADYASDALAATIQDKWPDRRTIQHVFTATDISSRLKQLIVDRAVAAGFGEYRKEEAAEWPVEFTTMALEASLRQLGRGTVHSGFCAYHVHTVNEECYRLKWEKSDAAKKWKEEMTRKRVTQCSEDAADFARRNGVKTFDWGAQRNGRQLVNGGPTPNGTAISQHDGVRPNELAATTIDGGINGHISTGNRQHKMEEPMVNGVKHEETKGMANGITNGVDRNIEAASSRPNGTSSSSDGSNSLFRIKRAGDPLPPYTTDPASSQAGSEITQFALAKGE